MKEWKPKLFSVMKNYTKEQFVKASLTYIDNQQLEDRLLPTSEEVAIKKDKQQIVKLLLEDTIDSYIYDQLSKKATKVEIINNFKAFLNKA